MQFTFKNRKFKLIHLVQTGSRMYGNHRPDSDYDYRGIYIESLSDKSSIENFPTTIGQADQDGEELYKAIKKSNPDLNIEKTNDIELYELNHFLKLASSSNPNIMDMLFTSNFIYLDTCGYKLINNRKLFLSKKIKTSFVEYAMSQMKKMNNHNKWLANFPHCHLVIEHLTRLYNDKDIDFDFISNNFSGVLAKKITNETPQNKVSYKYSLSLMDVASQYKEKYKRDLLAYSLPKLHKFSTLRTIEAKKLNINAYYKFLYNEAGFRVLNPSTIFIYEGGDGIFTPDGNLRPSEPKEVGALFGVLSIDYNKFKASRDYINKMWTWKVNRNEARGAMEDEFGYDLKHASHLIRLLDACKDILLNNDYNPKLKGDRLQLVKDVRDGKYSYKDIIELAESKKQEIDLLFKKSKLKDEIDFNQVVKLGKNIHLIYY